MSTVVIECIVGAAPVVTGTAEPVTGLTDGSSVVFCDAFADLRVTVKKNGNRLPRIDKGDGNYYTKDQIENFISFSNALATGDVIYIETIPQ